MRRLIAFPLILSLVFHSSWGDVSAYAVQPIQALRESAPAFAHSAVSPWSLFDRLDRPSMRWGFSTRKAIVATAAAFIFLLYPAQLQAQKKPSGPELKQTILKDATDELDKQMDSLRAILKQTADSFKSTLPFNSDFMDSHPEAMDQIAAMLVISAESDENPAVNHDNDPSWLKPVYDALHKVEKQEADVSAAEKEAQTTVAALPKTNKLKITIAAAIQAADQIIKEDKEAIAKLTLIPGSPMRVIYTASSGSIFIRASYESGGRLIIEFFEVRTRFAQKNGEEQDGIDLFLTQTSAEYYLWERKGDTLPEARRKVGSVGSPQEIGKFLATFHIAEAVAEQYDGALPTPSNAVADTHERTVSPPASVNESAAPPNIPVKNTGPPQTVSAQDIQDAINTINDALKIVNPWLSRKKNPDEDLPPAIQDAEELLQASIDVLQAQTASRSVKARTDAIAAVRNIDAVKAKRIATGTPKSAPPVTTTKPIPQREPVPLVPPKKAPATDLATTPENSPAVTMLKETISAAILELRRQSASDPSGIPIAIQSEIERFVAAIVNKYGNDPASMADTENSIKDELSYKANLRNRYDEYRNQYDPSRGANFDIYEAAVRAVIDAINERLNSSNATADAPATPPEQPSSSVVPEKIAEPTAPAPSAPPKPMPDPVVHEAIKSINDVISKTINPWFKNLAKIGLRAGPVPGDAESKLTKGLSDFQSHPEAGPETAARDKAQKDAEMALRQITAAKAIFAEDAMVTNAEISINQFATALDSIIKENKTPWIDKDLTAGTRKDLYLAALFLVAMNNKPVADILSPQFIDLYSFAQKFQSMQTADNQTLGENLGDKSKDFQRLSGQLKDRADRLVTQVKALMPVDLVSGKEYKVGSDDKNEIALLTVDKTSSSGPVISIKVFILINTTPLDQPVLARRFYEILLQNNILYPAVAADTVTGSRGQTFGGVFFLHQTDTRTMDLVPLSQVNPPDSLKENDRRVAGAA